MQEVEILVKLDKDLDFCVNQISKKIELNNKLRVIDTYFDHIWISKLNPGNNFRLTNCIRVREKWESSTVTYKQDYFDKDDVWTYSDEYETGIESADSMKEIFKQLWFTELVVVDNTKYYFYDNDYELVIEDVIWLWIFLEVEYKSNIKEWEEINIKNEIKNYINSLWFDEYEEMNAWKPELILKKNLK